MMFMIFFYSKPLITVINNLFMWPNINGVT